MLIATKAEAGGEGTIRVSVEGLMLGEGASATVRDVVCVCEAEGGRIRYITCIVSGTPDVFGEKQARHLQALCESVCKRKVKG